VWDWAERYEDPAVVDGTHWSLRLEHDGRAVSASGSNAVPQGWRAVQRAVEKLAEGRSWR
jgi:hypothetical protein